MFDSIYQVTEYTTGTIQALPLFICMLVSLALGAALAWVYAFHQRASRSFTLALTVLPAIVCVVITAVNGNLGAGVAVAGAFSLVRFRSAPGSGRDIAFVFLAMAVGLVAGMGYLGAAALVTLVIGGACLALQTAGSVSATDALTLKVTVPEDLDYTTAFDDVLARYTASHELTSVKTANMGSLFRLSYDVTLAPGADQRQLINEVRARNGNLEVAIAHHETGGYDL